MRIITRSEATAHRAAKTKQNKRVGLIIGYVILFGLRKFRAHCSQHLDHFSEFYTLSAFAFGRDQKQI